jgi:hypothetical protein
MHGHMNDKSTRHSLRAIETANCLCAMNVLVMLQSHGTGALVVSSMLDFLTFALCVPYSETTDGRHFDSLLEMVANRGRSLFRLFQV